MNNTDRGRAPNAEMQAIARNVRILLVTAGGILGFEVAKTLLPILNHLLP